MPKQNKLKAILAEKQLTVHDFAISVGIKPSTFYKKLAGQSVFTVSEALMICESLGIDNIKDVFLK